MRRREFISLIGGASVVLPLAARAQRLDRVMRIGVLGPRPENTGISGGVAAGYPAILDELRKLGFSEGRNLTAEFTELPVAQVTIFETVINLKTAKAIGIELPTSILLRADEVMARDPQGSWS